MDVIRSQVPITLVSGASASQGELQRTWEKRGPTIRNPFTQVARLRSASKAPLQLIAQILDGFVHQRLESQDAADGEVLCDGFLHPGVLSRIGHAKNVVHNLTADHDAVVVVEFSLERLETKTLESIKTRMATYLAPCLIFAIDGFDQLRAVKIEEVRADAHNRAVFIVEFLDAAGVLARPHQKEAPKVGPSCKCTM